MKVVLGPKSNKAWEVLRTVVYAVGYAGVCYVVVIWNYNLWRMNAWLGHQDLATVAFWTMIFTWLIWTIGTAAIIIDGMRKVQALCEKHK